MRDQYYMAGSGNATDWKVTGPHQSSKIIKEMITQECPDINGTAGIDANAHDIVGIDLATKGYPMDIIIDKLAPLSDTDSSTWYFGVFEDRKPYWRKRAVTDVHWLVHLADIERLSLQQQGKHLRNAIGPQIGTGTPGTFTPDEESTASYPLRELVVKLPAGVTDTVATAVRIWARDERKYPRQDETFSIKGHVYARSAREWSPPAAFQGMTEKPKYYVRAGDVIRIQDLVPYAASTGTLDDVRTFYILETRYDAGRDILEVQPDRPISGLSVLLTRLGQLEKDR